MHGQTQIKFKAMFNEQKGTTKVHKNENFVVCWYISCLVLT